MGMYIQMRLSHANVNQHRIHVNHDKYLSLAFTFTEKAENVYQDICCDFLCHCGIRTMPMTILRSYKEKFTSENNSRNNDKRLETKEGINGRPSQNRPVCGF